MKACEEHDVIVQAYSPLGAGAGAKPGKEGETKNGGLEQCLDVAAIGLYSIIRESNTKSFHFQF